MDRKEDKGRIKKAAGGVSEAQANFRSWVWVTLVTAGHGSPAPEKGLECLLGKCGSRP